MERMDDARRRLPAWNSREEFLQYTRESRGVVVTGETGCGKTTQIPQFINEVDPHAKVVVCQPRRLAAVGVATRVAEERCCALGEEVGYMVRGDSKCTGRTRLAFCTYGVMLRRLLDDPFLEGIDYVILDEVHERNVDSDFGLALLATALGHAKCRFKLILMSATISTDKFAAYLGEAISGKFQPGGGGNTARNRSRRAAIPAPVLEIPGFTFDVDMYYKADYEELLRGGSTTKSTLLASLREQEQLEQEEQEDDDEEGEFTSSAGRAYRTNRDSKRIGGTLVKGDIDWDLLVRLIMKLAAGEQQQAASNADGSVAKMFAQATGSVLIFLPGVPEINRFLQFLRKEWDSGGSGGSRVSLLTMALHGGLSAVDQKKVFIPARRGELKIVAATNVAEASITIPDVSVVVDTCKVKEMYFVPEKQMNALVTKMAPQDSLRQRRGRAGRVARGRCFRLITVGTHDNLPANGIPEILRVSIDGLILQIKAMQAVRASRGDSKEATALVLSRCPDPPTPSAILTSESLLTKMQAIDGEEGDITPLGKHLAALPCEPRTGRLLVYGALLGCAFPAAVVAAMLSCQSPFMNSSDPVKREEGNAAKAEFMSQSGYKSDQLAVVSAMKQWSACHGYSERRRFAMSHCLNHDRMGDIDKLAREFLGDLGTLGLVVNPAAASRGEESVDNCNSNRPKIVAAALCAGLYPQVSRILRPPKRFEGVLGSNFEKDVDGKEIRFYVPETVVEQPEEEDKDGDEGEKGEDDDDDVRPVRRRTRLRVHSSDEEDEEKGEDEDEGGKGQMKMAAPSAGNANKSEIDMEGMFRVFIHPSSVNFSNTLFGNSRYLLYGEISVSMNPGQGFKAYLRDTTEAATYPLLFFGGKLEAQYLQGTITIDNWIKFVASGKQVALIQATRRAFDAILTEKIENPSIDHHNNEVVKTVCALLNSNSNA
jgi:ATP-dependent RNA helicase DHX57